MTVITRRDFIKRAGGAAFARAMLGTGHCFGADNAKAETNSPRLTMPTPAQVAWQDCEIGLIYHFDISVAAGSGMWNNAARKTFDPNLYQPAKLDTDQWIEAAKACGARYAVFTATHFDGFMQWQSDAYPYGLKQTTWRDGKGDIVADFVASCRKAGIKPGIYFGVHRNVYQKVWGHYADWGKGRDTDAQKKFNAIAEKQMTELCSRYGPLIEIWFDAGTKTPAEGGPDMLPIFEKYQPDGLFYSSTQRSDHRWIGNEAGYAGYPCWATMPREGKDGPVSHNTPLWKKLLPTGDNDGIVWSPAMVDTTLRNVGAHDWMWSANHDDTVLPVKDLVKMYLESVGRNSNLVLGEVITPDGLVPEGDIKRLAEFGSEFKRRWGKSVAEKSAAGKTLELKLPAAGKIDSVVIMEDIAQGERIQSYTLEGLAGGLWKQLCKGQSIGHKRIECFPAVEISAVRLTVDKCKAEPQIRKLAAFGPGKGDLPSVGGIARILLPQA